MQSTCAYTHLFHVTPYCDPLQNVAGLVGVVAIQDRDAVWFEMPELDRPKVLYMNSCFFTKLCQEAGGYIYSNVQRWTTARKLRQIGVDRYQGIRDVDKVVIPVHLGNHWVRC